MLGTYTQKDSHGIYVAQFDTETGKFGVPLLAAETTDPSFLAIHPSGKFLYSVGETAQFEGRESGFVRAFRVDRASGQLSPLNSQISSGTGPCHLGRRCGGQDGLGRQLRRWQCQFDRDPG